MVNIVQNVIKHQIPGLAVATVGGNAFESCKGLIDKCVTVDECHIALAILRLVENEKAVVEGAGAVGLAALLAGKCPELLGNRYGGEGTSNEIIYTVVVLFCRYVVVI